MSPPAHPTQLLTLHHIYGCKTTVNQPLHYLSEQEVLYIAGHQIVIYHLEQKRQRFLTIPKHLTAAAVALQQYNKLHSSNAAAGNNSSEDQSAASALTGTTEVTAVALTTIKNSHGLRTKVLAVAEGQTLAAATANASPVPIAPVIHIFDLSTGKYKLKAPLSNPEQQSTQVHALTFSNDGKQLLVLGSKPDWLLSNYQWEKSSGKDGASGGVGGGQNSRVLQSAKVSNHSSSIVNAISFCAVDPSVVAVIGHTILRFLHIENGEFRTIPFLLNNGVNAKDFTASMSPMADQSMSAALQPPTGAIYYTCHIWLGGRVIVGTSLGQLLVFENAEHKATITVVGNARSLTTNHTYDEPCGISTLCATSKGFYVGTDLGMIYLYEYETQSASSNQPASQLINTIQNLQQPHSHPTTSHYKCTKQWQIPDYYSSILSIVINPMEDTLLCMLVNHQLMMLSLNNPITQDLQSVVQHEKSVIQGVKTTLSTVSTDMTGSEDGSDKTVTSKAGAAAASDLPVFEPMLTNFHFAPIVGLTTCIRKPLVATCSYDKSVRLWNYLTKSLELTVYFTDTPLSISLHPSGLHLLVSFYDTLKLMNILLDTMTLAYDYGIRNIQQMKFCHGGHLFVIANGTLIQVYTTYTHMCIGTYNIHRSRITSLTFTTDDTQICSTSADGTIYLTNIKSQQSQLLYKQKVSITSGCMIDTYVYASSSDGKLVCIDTNTNTNVNSNNSSGSAYYTTEVSTQSSYTTLSTLHHRDTRHLALLGSTAAGTLTLYQLPLDGKGQIVEQHLIHNSTIHTMIVAYDDLHVFTVGEDSLLCVYTLDLNDLLMLQPNTAGQSTTQSTVLKQQSRHRHSQSMINSNPANATNNDSLLQWSEEILITRSELIERLNVLSSLQATVDDLYISNEITMKNAENSYREEYRQLTERYNERHTTLQQHYQRLQQEKTVAHTKYDGKLNHLRDLHTIKTTELKQHYTQKLQHEQDRYAALQQKLQQLREDYRQQLVNLDEQHQQQMTSLHTSYTNQIQQQLQHTNSMKSEQHTLSTDLQRHQIQHESMIDNSIYELQSQYESRLTNERLTTIQYKDQNLILKRKYDLLRTEIQRNLDLLSEEQHSQTQLQSQIESYQHEIRSLQNEVGERESTMNDKLQRIDELQKKNLELEKFKFVLDYKITELQKQIQPRKQELQTLQQQLREMSNEQQMYSHNIIKLQYSVRELNLKLNATNNEYTQLSSLAVHAVQQYRRLQYALYELYQQSDRFEQRKNTKNGVVRLYQQYVKSNSNVTTPPLTLSDSAAADVVSSTTDDIHRNYERQRHYLERSLDSLSLKLQKDQQTARKEQQRYQNEQQVLHHEVQSLEQELIKMRELEQRVTGEWMAEIERKMSRKMSIVNNNASQLSLEQEVQRQQEEIRALQQHLLDVQQQNAQLGLNPPVSIPGSRQANRTASSDMLAATYRRPASQQSAVASPPSALMKTRQQRFAADQEEHKELSGL